MADYVQLTLWEHDGEVFVGEAPDGADAVSVSVPRATATYWEMAAQHAAQRQRDLHRQYDLATSTRGM